MPQLLLRPVLAGYAPGGEVYRPLVAAGAVDVAPQGLVKVYRAMKEHRPFDPGDYARRLSELPGGWPPPQALGPS